MTRKSKGYEVLVEYKGAKHRIPRPPPPTHPTTTTSYLTESNCNVCNLRVQISRYLSNTVAASSGQLHTPGVSTCIETLIELACKPAIASLAVANCPVGSLSILGSFSRGPQPPAGTMGLLSVGVANGWCWLC